MASSLSLKRGHDLLACRYKISVYLLPTKKLLFF
jgi:hypothetical protein